MQYFMKYDPVPALQQVKCPVLALNGENDLQVPSRVNLDAIEKHVKIMWFRKFALVIRNFNCK